MSDDYIFTSESVTLGHPDKLCDQVSDAVVDHFLRQDPDSRIVAECAVSSGVMFISASVARLCLESFMLSPTNEGTTFAGPAAS